MVKTVGTPPTSGSLREVRPQIHRHEAGLPVVRVDDRRPLAAHAWILERGAAEDGEAPRVVGIVAVRAVKRLAIEELGHVDEHELDAIRQPAFVEGDGLQPIAQSQPRLEPLGAVDGNLAIARQDERDGVAELPERVAE